MIEHRIGRPHLTGPLVINRGTVEGNLDGATRTRAVKAHLKAAGITGVTVDTYSPNRYHLAREVSTRIYPGPRCTATLGEIADALLTLPWAMFLVITGGDSPGAVTVSIRAAWQLLKADAEAEDTHRTDTAALAAVPLVIVPCGGRKLTVPAPAGEMYVGSYHAATRRAAAALAAATGARVMILSAKYGLLDLDRLIAPYEQHMSKPGAITRGELTAQARALGIDQATDVTVIAGRAYADAVTSVWPHATRPLDGTRGMGEQKARMARMGRDTAA